MSVLKTVRSQERAPDNDVVLHTWNGTTRFEVDRDTADHRVTVTEVMESRWTVHIVLSGALGFIAVLVLVLAAGLPLLYVPLLMAVIGMVVYALLRYEQTIAGTVYEEGEPVMMDSEIWEGIKQDIADEMVRVQGDKKRDSTFGAFLSSSAVVNYVDSIRHHCHSEPQRRYHYQLGKALLEERSRLEDYGRGIRGCVCQACRVAEKLDVTVAEPGISAARRRAVDRVVIGRIDGVDVIGWWSKRQAAQRKESAAKALVAEQKKADREKQRSIDAERKRKAKEYVDNAYGKTAKSEEVAEKKAQKQRLKQEKQAVRDGLTVLRAEKKAGKARVSSKQSARNTVGIDDSAVDEVAAYLDKMRSIGVATVDKGSQSIQSVGANND